MPEPKVTTTIDSQTQQNEGRPQRANPIVM